MEQRIGVERVVRWRVLEDDLVEPDLQFLRQQHGQRGVGALSHLDHRHDQGDLTLAIDADEGVRYEWG